MRRFTRALSSPVFVMLGLSMVVHLGRCPSSDFSSVVIVALIVTALGLLRSTQERPGRLS